MLVPRRQDASVPRVRLPETIDTVGGPRTARNMLKPMSIPQRAWIREEWTHRDDYPEWVTSAARPCVIVGEIVKRKTPIFSRDGCLSPIPWARFWRPTEGFDAYFLKS
jgi:hypothetical protein